MENVGDGPDDPSNYVLLRRGKRHDYFTSALPWPQKGPAVNLPLGTSAPVVLGSGASGNIFAHADASYNVYYATNGLKADLTAATAATINQLRQAFQVQRLYERDARSGTRYTEIIRAHFGVQSPDARLQRPEFLGGGSTPVNINPVAQTSASSSQPSPLGNLAAYATASLRNNGFTKSFTEHGIIIGLDSVS